MGLPHHLDVFYHLDASINFLPTTSAFFPAFGKAEAGGCLCGDQGMA